MAGWSRRRLLAATASTGALTGCGYRPGWGDRLWTRENLFADGRPDLLVVEDVVVAVYDEMQVYDAGKTRTGGIFVAYDQRTGEIRWKRRYGESRVRDWVADETGFHVVTDEDEVLAVGASDGERWRISTPWEARVGRLARGGGVLYAAGEGALFAFDAESGTELWRREVDSEGPVAATESGVYLCEPHPRGGLRLKAYAPDRGMKWSGLYDDLDGAASSPELAANDEVVLFSSESQVVALSAADGRSLWRDAGLQQRPYPVLTADRVYHQGQWGTSALSPVAGEAVWHFEPESGGRLARPAVGGDRVFIGGDAGLYAVSVADGRRHWSFDRQHLHGTAEPTGAPGVVAQPVLTDDGVVVQTGRRRVRCFKRT